MSELGGLPRSLCGGPAVSGGLSVSGPSALCVGPRRSLCRAPALFASGPGALCRELASGPGKDSFCRVPAVCVSGPGAFCRVLCRGALCVGPALCLGARLFGSGLCRGPALLVSGPGALCVGARRSFYRATAFSVRVRVCGSRSVLGAL